VRRVLTLAVLAVAAVLLAPSPAGAASCDAQPGTAAVDQYCVLVPSAGGSESPFAIDPDTPRLRDVLSPAQVRRLERMGPAGRALLAMPVVTPRRASAMTPSLREDLTDVFGQGDLVAGGASRQLPVALRSDLGTVSSFSPAFRWVLLLTLIGLVATARQGGRARRARSRR
jgi:hypothetical protein